MRGKLVVGSAAQIVACVLLLRPRPARIWLLVAVGLLVGVPQGLDSLANQNALYHQADPARMGSSAGLLRTFMYLGAIAASAADARCFRHGATTAGLHHLAWSCWPPLLLLAAPAGPLAGRSRVAAGPPTHPTATARPVPPERKPMALTTLDPHTALVLVDLQNGVLGVPTGPYAAAEVLARSVRAGRRLPRPRPARRAGPGHRRPRRRRRRPRPHRRRRAPGGPPAGLGRPRRRPHRPDPGDIVVTKRNWGAFYGTDLDLQLRRRGVTQIVLTGIATSIGVESTARAAHEHGYHVTLPATR